MTHSERTEEIFDRVVDLPLEERESLLAELCGDDSELRVEVESLLSFANHETQTVPQLRLASKAPPGHAGSPPQERPGSTIGPYKLLEVIGEGGMGTVFLASQEKPIQRRVALKLVKLGMDTREVMARFETERQSLALMDHPNIARVLDAGSTGHGRPYFVMEHVPGVPFTEYCDREKLDTRQRLSLFVTVCQAVQHAHQKGIIHRDLKPSNVLVMEQDGKPVPKVIDFGVARAVTHNFAGATVYTEQGQLIGTFEYMSPEQTNLSGLEIDARSDLYSLGVLLYQTLTGVLPFDGDTLREAGLEQILRVIREEDPPKPSTRLTTLNDDTAIIARSRHTDTRSLKRQLQGDLDWITMKAMEKTRTRRYASASELASDIERHLRNDPVLAGPPGAGYRLRKFVRRNRATVVFGLAVGLSLVAGIIGTTWGMLDARDQREAAVEEARKASAAKELADTEKRNALTEKENALEKAEQARTAIGLVVGALKLTNPELALDRASSLRQMLDRVAHELEGETFSDLPEAQAAVETVIGQNYLAIGDYPTANTHLRKALELLEARPDEPSREIYEVLKALIRVMNDTLADDRPERIRQYVVLGARFLAEECPGLKELLDLLPPMIEELNEKARIGERLSVPDPEKEKLEALIAGAGQEALQGRAAEGGREPVRGDRFRIDLARYLFQCGRSIGGGGPYGGVLASQLFEAALAIQEVELVPRHSDIARSRFYLAQRRHNKHVNPGWRRWTILGESLDTVTPDFEEQIEGVQEAYEQALEMLDETKRDQWITDQNWTIFGNFLVTRGYWEELNGNSQGARALYEKAESILLERYELLWKKAPSALGTQQALYAIIKLYLTTGRPGEALERQRRGQLWNTNWGYAEFAMFRGSHGKLLDALQALKVLNRGWAEAEPRERLDDLDRCLSTARKWRQQSLPDHLPDNRPLLAFYADHMHTSGQRFRNRRRYREGEQLTREALATYERVLPPNHAKIARSLLELFMDLASQARHEEAAECAERLLKTQYAMHRAKKSGMKCIDNRYRDTPWGPDLNAGIAEYEFILGRQYNRLERFEEAAKYLPKSYKVLEEYHGDSLNHLGIGADLVRGALKELVDLYEGLQQPELRDQYLKLLIQRRRAHADEAGAFPSEIRDLAWLLLTGPDPQQRNYAEALPLAERALELESARCETLGRRVHGRFFSTLGYAHYHNGDKARALDEWAKVSYDLEWEFLREVFEVEHPNLTTHLDQLHEAIEKPSDGLGDIWTDTEESRRLAFKSLASEANSKWAQIYSDLISGWAIRGVKSGAPGTDDSVTEAMLLEVLSLRETHLTPAHAKVGRTLHWLARLHEKGGAFPKAEPFARRSLEIFKKVHSPTNFSVINGKTLLGSCLTGLGRFEEAELLVKDGYLDMRARWGRNDRDVLRAFERYVRFLVASGRRDKANQELKAHIQRAQMHGHDGAWLDSVAWAAVRTPDLNPEVYALARDAAARAVKLSPDRATRINTWGVALYRVGDYPAALIQLEHSNRQNKGQRVWDLAFLAMTHTQLGATDAARDELERLRALMKVAPNPTRLESQELSREAERVCGAQ